jgi:hypothetical protein
VQLEGADLTVEARRIPLVTYPPEWPTVAFQDAALKYLEVLAVLIEGGFSLKDGHPWNILFENRRPVFVDLGSVSASPGLEWLDEFRATFLLPLMLHRYGLHSLANRALLDKRGLGIARLARLQRHRMFPSVLGPSLKGETPINAVRKLHRWVAKLNIVDQQMTWSDYDQHPADHHANETFNGKQRTVFEILDRMPRGTLLDMASNAGWYSELAAKLGYSVLAADIDDAAIGTVHRRLAGSDLAIECAKVDFVWPQGSYGMGLLYSSAYERFQSDTVLALAVLHHLAGHQGVTFGMFASIIHRLARERAIVEFVPREDAHVKDWPIASKSWYTEEELVRAFSPYFRRVHRYPSSPDPRIILLFER